MRRAFLILPVILLAGCEPGQGGGLGAALGLPATAPAAPPPGVDAGDLAAFRAAVAEAGCQVTGEEQAAVVEARTGLDEAQLRGVVEYLAGQGELADAPGTGFVLASGACAQVASGAG